MTMSEHRSTLNWKRQSADFNYDTFNREHTLTFKEGVSVAASAAPAYKGKAGHIDPEEMLVGAASSCHMLTFLAIAAKKGITVESYVDNAVGFLEKNDDGMMAVTRIELHPKVTFASQALDQAGLERLHESAHHHCFVANSVASKITVHIEK